MPCPMVVGRFPFAVPVASTAESWLPLTKPLVIVGGEALDFALTVTRATGNAAAIPGAAYMTARPDLSATPSAASGSFTGTQGTTHHVVDLTGTTDKYFVQGGVLTKLNGGSTAGFVQGVLSVQLKACASPIGQRMIEVTADQTNASPSTYLLGRVPAAGAANLRAALVCNAINDVEYRFFARGVNDPEEPDAWVALGAGYTALPETTPMAICQSDLSVSGVTPASYHQLEFALRLRLTGAGSGPAGFVRVSAGLSYT